MRFQFITITLKIVISIGQNDQRRTVSYIFLNIDEIIVYPLSNYWESIAFGLLFEDILEGLRKLLKPII